MSEEILINVSPRETRVAIVENGGLQELLLERESRRGLVGNIYKGTVVRILPGMQAAFVDIGLDRAAFLHVTDMLFNEEYDKPERESTEESILALLREGQSIVVQVVKDPIGSKGPRVTTRISLPSRYLVFMPDLDHTCVSARIENESERVRLKKEVEGLLPLDHAGGFIVRTAAEGVDIEDIRSNCDFLIKQWEAIGIKSVSAVSGEKIHSDLPLEQRVLRDYSHHGTEKIRVDERVAFDTTSVFVEKFVPTLVQKIELYAGEKPLFDLYGIEEEIQKALERKVSLKCGGYLIFDQTEALTTIDVNTGAFVGHRNLEETIFKTNLEAAATIARQLRIRNLGGMIIIDFIDMDEEEHQRQVLKTLEKALAKDHAKSKISGVSALGLVEMTRKRTRESLAHVLCESCVMCAGRGEIKTVETVCYEIIRELLRAIRMYDPKVFLVLASQAVVERLMDEESDTLEKLERLANKPIKFQVESLYTQEQFDVVLR